MIDSYQQARACAMRWGLPVEDVLLIALNACGVDSRIEKPRMRFRLRLHSRPDDQRYLILSLGRRQSPFVLTEDAIWLGGEPIAEVDALEDDDAVLAYWRNGRRVMTLNSNARSQCTGCVFCPNTLEDAADPHLREEDELDAHFAAIVADAGMDDLAGVEAVTVCTGCFHHEHLALAHLRKVRAAMGRHGCDGRLHFLSSVLTTPAGLRAAAEELGPFHLTLTAECFTGRERILKSSKADLAPAAMVEILGHAKDLGITTDFTYIVGLDDLDVAERQLREFVPVTSTFPRFQVYQSHNRLMDLYAAPGAGGIDYYLKARQMIEGLFAGTGLRPRSWENYRPLWYTTFAGEDLDGGRI